MNKFITLILFGLIIVGCNEVMESNSNTDNKDGWKLEKQVTKTVENLRFTFPSEGYAYDNRELFVQESIDAIKENCSILNFKNYKQLIKIRVLDTREELGKHTGMAVSGFVNPHTSSVYLVANIDGDKAVKPPIKHELMHMISMSYWGVPQKNLDWIKEGLAAYAENNCNGYNVEEIYRYLLEKDMLIPLDSLVNNFYRQEEMVGYHQSAYIVEYLIDTYGLKKFKKLWIQGQPAFEGIYEIPFSKMKLNINEKVLKDYPNTPNIDWKIFKEGCK